MQDKVKGPAVALVVVAALGALLSIMGLAFAGAMGSFYESMGMPEEQLEQMRAMQGANFAMTLIATVFAVAADAFVIWAALRMMKLQGWVPAVVASFLVMIPCFSSICCIVGVPVGIWSLVVLFNADVKRAFQGEPPPL